MVHFCPKQGVTFGNYVLNNLCNICICKTRGCTTLNSSCQKQSGNDQNTNPTFTPPTAGTLHPKLHLNYPRTHNYI